MNSGAGDTTQLVPGYPIRTPWDHSSVDNSPRPIAASHVLHRPLVPRHPPSALDNLTTKMLTPTMHISTNNQPTPTPHHQPTGRTATGGPGRAWPHHPAHPNRGPRGRCLKPNPTGVVVSGPNRMLPAEPPHPGHRCPPPPNRGRRYPMNPAHAGVDRASVSTHEHPHRHNRAARGLLPPAIRGPAAP